MPSVMAIISAIIMQVIIEKARAPTGAPRELISGFDHFSGNSPSHHTVKFKALNKKGAKIAAIKPATIKFTNLSFIFCLHIS